MNHDEDAIFAAMRRLWARTSFTPREPREPPEPIPGQYVHADGRRYSLDDAQDRIDLEARVCGRHAPTALNPDP